MKRFATLLFLAPLVACGGSVDSGTDGGSDAADELTTLDGGGDEQPITKPYDGVVGKACTSDSDCKSAGGPGLAKCSSSVFAPQDFYPTPVCILPSCNPVSDTSGLHFCDGPDAPSSPGICVPYATSGTVCLPKCDYDKHGGAPTGCAGHDACFAYASATENGVGYCWAACTQDGDCSNGQKCQIDEGWCVQGVQPPTKNLGDTCTSSDTNLGTCNCLYGNANSGYCSSFCLVGGTQCPGGYVCDSLETRINGYSTPNVGMAGYCAIDCTGDGGVCPSTSVCTNVFATGPDCIPP